MMAASGRGKDLTGSTTDLAGSYYEIDDKKDLSASAHLSLSTSYVNVDDEKKSPTDKTLKKSVGDLKDELDEIARQRLENEQREAQIQAVLAEQEVLYVPSKNKKSLVPEQLPQQISNKSSRKKTIQHHPASSWSAAKILGATALVVVGVAATFFSLRRKTSGGGVSNNLSPRI